MINQIKTIWEEHQEELLRQSNILKKRNWQGEVEAVIIKLMQEDDPILSVLALQGRINSIKGFNKDIPKQYYFKPQNILMAITKNVFSDTFHLVTLTEDNAKYIMANELKEYFEDIL